MIEVNALRKGTTFTHENELYKVLDYTHNKTGRGGRIRSRELLAVFIDQA